MATLVEWSVGLHWLAHHKMKEVVEKMHYYVVYKTQR